MSSPASRVFNGRRAQAGPALFCAAGLAVLGFTIASAAERPAAQAPPDAAAAITTPTGAATAPAAPAAAVPAPVSRPPWLSAAEQRFLDSTGGLRPVATFDSSNSLVSIKLKKPGRTMDQIFEVAIGPKYDYFKHTSLVETSFRGEMGGRNYLFTGTIVEALLLKFRVPVVSEFTDIRDANHINIVWKTPGIDVARQFVNAQSARLAQVLAEARIGESVEDYKETILEHLPDTTSVWGQHDYYPASGYYIYQQKVRMAGTVSDTVARYVGGDDITGAALKVAYQVIGEPTRAGERGRKGVDVVTMDGRKIHSGP